MALVLKSLQAQADLESILQELDDSDPKAAERFAEGVDTKCEALGRFPEIGRPREEILPGVRSTLVGKYVLFYRARGDIVEVLRILHGRRDLRSTLRDEA